MGIAAYLIWRQGLSNSGVRVALLIFIAQLVVNVVWSAVFFGLQSLLGGLVVIVILWAAILWTIIKFYPLSAAAGLLLVPYLLWVSFASVLNFSIFLLNR
jgi:tryptophan-rich sensory protein